MGVIPSPHQLTVRRRGAQTGVDRYGRPQYSWSSNLWLVRSIDPGTSTETDDGSRDALSKLRTVHADRTPTIPGPLDVVELDGADWKVDGDIEDYTRGPWANPAAGVVVTLKRVEG